jgi:phosphatidylglycerophosphatase A
MKQNDSSLGRNRALADAVAGVVASLVSLWTFYPIEVWKTNAQAEFACSKNASLYQGCGVKSLHTTSSSFAYFFLYSYIFQKWTQNEPKKKISHTTQLVLSAVAAMINTLLTLPLDVMSSKLVIQKKETKTFENEKMDQVWDELGGPEEEEEGDNQIAEFEEEKKEEALSTIPEHKRIIHHRQLKLLDSKDENWFSLWKGLTPSLLLCSNPSINYTVYDIAKTHVLARRSTTANLSMGDAFLVGLFSKFVATIATYPLIRAKVMLMVTSENSMIACLLRSYRQDGVRGLYKGCDLQLIHTVLKSALIMMIREKITASTHRLIVGETKK